MANRRQQSKKVWILTLTPFHSTDVQELMHFGPLSIFLPLWGRTPVTFYDPGRKEGFLPTLGRHSSPGRSRTRIEAVSIFRVLLPVWVGAAAVVKSRGGRGVGFIFCSFFRGWRRRPPIFTAFFPGLWCVMHLSSPRRRRRRRWPKEEKEKYTISHSKS